MAERRLPVGNGERSRLPIATSELDLDRVRAAVRDIRYGEVRVIIQDGLIVQIERLEKQRLR
ncbi:YezD family protein [Planctomyces sp. SH-PL62]|uniref:YezD family protein n=1 Tax=Planctomyces sp. SH-PL62 TaxID=1636152 RepID=UPI00078C99E1|nr:YezD family protein [Planctomyces sp. SH-PL62]AMV38134.1 hypothetical protein VT85_11900 [Planctomyces sp. SH-PL62]